jgi:hypothetical protein
MAYHSYSLMHVPLDPRQMHERDPFGDEHNGAWYLYAKGSGVWYNIGKTISFRRSTRTLMRTSTHSAMRR